MENFEYDAWGNDLAGNFSSNSSGIRYFQNGKYFDTVTGLYYNQSRWYDPRLGRFLSESPISPMSEEEYVFCKNDPVNFADVNGKTPLAVPFGFVAGGLIDAGFQLWENGGDVGNIDYERVAGAAFVGGMLGPVGEYLGGFVGKLGGSIAKPVGKFFGRLLGGVGDDVARTAAQECPSIIDNVIEETLNGTGNFTSQFKLSADEALKAGEKFLGPGYKEIGNGILEALMGLSSLEWIQILF